MRRFAIKSGTISTYKCAASNTTITPKFRGSVRHSRVYRYPLGKIPYLVVLTLYFLLEATVGLHAQSGGCTPAFPGLISLWRGESNALDSVGDNDGTLVGNTTTTLGHVGQAFVFDGLFDGIDLGNPTNLQLQNFTIEAWIRRASPTRATQDPVENRGCILHCGFGGYGFALVDDGSLTLTQVGVGGVLSPPLSVADTNYHHVALTKSNATIIFYVDGVSKTSGLYDPGFTFTSPLAIGGRGGDYSTSFWGAIDELAIYNRALSSNEIQAIYDAGSFGKCDLPTVSILSQPTNQSVVIGDSATFSVTAGGQSPFSYQWQKESSPITGATNNFLTLTNVSLTDDGNFTVVVQNELGSSVTSIVATLTVLVPVSITNQPTDQVTPYGGSATFSVGASGNPPPAYQWRFNGSIIPNATLAGLTRTNVATNHLGDYSVIASNSVNSTTSTVAVLFMSPSIRTPFVGGTAVWGHDALLNVTAIGSGDLSYQWYFNGVIMAGGTNAALSINTIQFTNGGLYSVVVSSTLGSVTNIPYELVIYPADVSLGVRASLTIGGTVGYAYQIQYSTNLSETNLWTSITNFTLTQPIEIWVDTSVDVRDQPKRYYKVLPQ